MGFEVRSKDLQVFYGGSKKGDWDVGIAMDVMRLAPKLDTIVLVSGDGDFSDLLEHAKSLGCRTEVLAFGKRVCAIDRVNNPTLSLVFALSAFFSPKAIVRILLSERLL